MNRLIFNVILLLLCLCLNAQTYIDLQERLNIRKHALDNINEFENILNLIAISNNPEEKKQIITNCTETIFDKSVNIEDDLNPRNIDLNFANFISVESYLELFSLVFNCDKSAKAVIFSNVQVSDVHTNEFTYVNVYFECLFSGTHKIEKTRFKKVLRIATIKVFQSQGKNITKIVSIKFSNSSELAKITKESFNIDKELDNIPVTTYNQIFAQKEYEKYMQEAETAILERDFREAKEKIRNALVVKPNDRRASNKLKEIERIELNILDGKAFYLLVADADDAFNNENYSLAYKYYKKAQKLKPNDEHVNIMMKKTLMYLDPIYY